MEQFKINLKTKKCLLALGPESAGNFCFFYKKSIYFSQDFGDLLDDKNFSRYKKALSGFLRKNKIKPAIIVTDLHPLYKTTTLGKKLAKKYKAEHIQVQHHVAHVFSSIGDKILTVKKYKPKTAVGIALDGTGYGTDGKIWGGEIFKISKNKTARIGRLENQILIGGDLAVKEPARVLMAILDKFLPKEKVYNYVKGYYSVREFEVLHNQLWQNFNCIETSSAGRILDAVSVLLGFTGNKRKYKHEAAELLEKNSRKPCAFKPVIIFDKKEKAYVLQTTPLFEYLIKNMHQDRKRLAATAQLYVAQGLYVIARKSGTRKDIFLAGGIGNNKIISSFLESKGAWKNKKVPHGDAGLSFGQLVYFIQKIKNRESSPSTKSGTAIST